MIWTERVDHSRCCLVSGLPSIHKCSGTHWMGKTQEEQVLPVGGAKKQPPPLLYLEVLHDASDSSEVRGWACCCGKQYSWTWNYKYSKLVNRLSNGKERPSKSQKCPNESQSLSDVYSNIVWCVFWYMLLPLCTICAVCSLINKWLSCDWKVNLLL